MNSKSSSRRGSRSGVLKDMYTFVIEKVKDLNGKMPSTLPSGQVISVIESLRDAISMPFDEDLHLHLLEDIYQLAISKRGFHRQGNCWSYIGFQREDPVSDIRGGGILSLYNLIFFLEHHSDIARCMIIKRSDREDGVNYPWAAAGVNITRLLAAHFEIIDSQTGVILSSSSEAGLTYSKSPKWEFLTNEINFNRSYCCAFVLLDSIFDEFDAKYFDFPAVLQETKIRFENLLCVAKNIDDLEILVKLKSEIAKSSSHDSDV